MFGSFLVRLVSDKRDSDSNDVVELSRGTQFRGYKLPPDPPIDYDLSPSPKRDAPLPPKFPIHSKYQEAPSKSNLPYTDPHASFKRRMNPSPQQEFWSSGGRSVNRQAARGFSF